MVGFSIRLIYSDKIFQAGGGWNTNKLWDTGTNASYQSTIWYSQLYSYTMNLSSTGVVFNNNFRTFGFSIRYFSKYTCEVDLLYKTSSI